MHGWFKQGSFSDFPFLFISSILSGIDELSRTGFDFISHSLLGSPLSRELGTTGRGLQGGALLITGAKVSVNLTITVKFIFLQFTESKLKYLIILKC